MTERKLSDGVGRVLTRLILGTASLAAAVVGTVSFVTAVDGWPARAIDGRGAIWAGCCFAGAVAMLIVYVLVTVAPHGNRQPFEGSAVRSGVTASDAAVEAILERADLFHAHQAPTAEPHPERASSANTAPPERNDAAEGENSEAALQDASTSGMPQRAAADFYRDIVLRPAELTPRISEFVEPHRASKVIRTTLTVRAPAAVTGSVIVPVFRAPRGAVLTGLRLIGPDGTRVSSLSQSDALGYAFGVIRTLLTPYPAALGEYKRMIEKKLIKHLLELDPTVDPGGDATLYPLLLQVQDLAGIDEDLAPEIEQLLAAHLRYNFVCVVAEVAPATDDPTPRTLRLIVERAEPKEAVARRREAERLSWVARLVFLTLPAVRKFVGVETTIYQHPLELANLAGSYHLEMAGPRGTYLAKQALRPTGEAELTPASGTNIVLAPRTGQRFSHVYIRNNGTDFKGVFVANTFYERPPGAVLLAWLSAVAAWVIVFLCALKALLRPEAAEPHADLVAVLLAFPPGIALWAGFGETIRQTLSAHVSRLTTILASAIAAYLYVLGPPRHDHAVSWWHDPASCWAVVMSVLTVTLVGSGFSLITRAVTNGRVRKSST
ncbi:hypothetical protein [Curtobacterium sp. PhB136]|uniref:hypothetical protein n=1 Tax=Curtobacterium sp. PhB136 TaxID=2485181 RepID=UPI00104ECBB6|nr:hypothetical protein [Curtobacterium sp. PhB136]TCK65781.1 hypothetical protein EDF27_0522 [Curtobacterium sp. PhB136]